MKIGIATLGCDKNKVDTEYLAGVLAQRGHEVVGQGEQNDIDVLVLYTCGFIEAARAESLDALFQLAEAKREQGNPRRLIMAGCLAQRWGAEMAEELDQVDAVAGVGQPEALADLVEEVGARDNAAPRNIQQPAPPTMRSTGTQPRKRLDALPSVYLKIADGCDHACAFCAIPAMKGPYASVAPDLLINEAEALIASGAKEINLIAQDIAPYGKDLDDDIDLCGLLTRLCEIPGDFWIRLLYLYPAGLTDALIQLIADQPKICNYVDIPLQHLDPAVLKAMRRPAGDDTLRQRIDALRKAIPDIVIRTTMIVGFPGESSKSFKILAKGVEELEFERLGAFAYSPEEGTPAVDFDDEVDDIDIERRLSRLMKIQADVSEKKQQSQVGRTLPVLIEGIAEEEQFAYGRSYREAPDVDGEIIIPFDDPAHAPQIGQFINVKITEAETYDLIGEAT